MPERFADVIGHGVGPDVTSRQDPGEFLCKPALRDRLLSKYLQEFPSLLLDSRKHCELGFKLCPNVGM